MAYEVEFEPAAIRHLKSVSAYERGSIVQAVQGQLVQTPTHETRNRKRLEPNPLAEWELRLGEIRIFYSVTESEQQGRVVAIGRKDHERVIIEGKEHPL